MLLTKIWATILAALATACLAGMFMLSFGHVGGFSDADRDALSSATEAGLAALNAQIQSSPVQRAPALLTDTRLRRVIQTPPPEDSDEPDLQEVLDLVSDEALLADNPKMSVGLVDPNGTVTAASGIAAPLIQEAVATSAYQDVAPAEEAVFSAILGKKLHVVKVSRATADSRRLVAIQMLDIGAGSLLRRVLGTRNPAGIVRDGALLGEMIGDQPLQDELGLLAREHAEEAPDEGASQVFTVGEGLDARLGAVGRVPGPAGQGKNGARLAVLTPMTAAAGQRDLEEALAEARKAGHIKRLRWGLLVGLFVVSSALAFYLPTLEAQGPIRRLTGEFIGIAQGTQHQIYHDRYGGIVKDLARAAAQAQDALRNAYMTDVDFEDEDEDETAAHTVPARTPSGPTTGPHARPKSKPKATPAEAPGSREEALAKARAPAPIELPDLDEGNAVIERTGQSASTDGDGADRPSNGATGSSAGGSASAKRAGQGGNRAPRPAADFNEDLVESDDVSLKAAFADDAGSAPDPVSAPGPAAAAPATAPARAAAAPPPAPRRRSNSGPHPKEDYFRGIYDEFVQTKMAVGESVENFTFEKFARKLAKNTEDLKQRPGVKDVEFSVYVKDGKAALKAKVIKE